MKQIPPIAAAILLGACTAIPVKTLYKLATADLMTVDPSVLRVAGKCPIGLRRALLGSSWNWA
jgi:hypothetical protein